MKFFTLLLCGLFLMLQAQSQNNSLDWKDYLSFANGNKVVATSGQIFCATDGGLFYQDREDNSVNKFNGLSDLDIKTMAWFEAKKMLLVGYKNGNIDLVTEGNVFNLSDIKRKSISADKTIYNITLIDDEAYLSCGFGIVVLNLNKQEIKDTYFIGDGGMPLVIYDVERFGNNLYAATAEGLKKAPAQGANLLDYNEWNDVSDIPNAGGKFTFLAVHANNLLANFSTENLGDELFAFNGSNWSSYHSTSRNLNDLSAEMGHLLLSRGDALEIIDEAGNVSANIESYKFGDVTVYPIAVRSATIASDGAVYIADNINALVKRIGGGNYEQIAPPGPTDNRTFFLAASQSALWITPGGRTSSWNNSFIQPQFQRFREGQWNSFNKTNIPEMTGFHDVVAIAIDPADEDHFFVASWGGGIWEFRNDALANHYTHKNSPLETALPSNPDEPFTRIGGMDFDSNGNLWITCVSIGGDNLHKLSPAGEWESFTMENAQGKEVGQVLVTQRDDKWVLVPRGHDAYVANRDGSVVKQLLVKSYFSNGKIEKITPMNNVYSIAEDTEGAIWIGTSRGVAVYNAPWRIWDVDPFYASHPGLDLGDGIYHPLLETETVTAIAVDAGNRKWLGTRGAGIYLISPGGDEELLHFTAENSPLLSNNITAIAIHEKSGEIFIGTDKGLIAYKGEASGGKATYDEVYVYPNPVRETYDGPVTIAGLISDTDVKITDISGNLVHKTTSLGGKVIWDGNNLNGNRVKTGVYLVFCNDKEGNETHIAKLLFIH